jgi:hypothetical protein
MKPGAQLLIPQPEAMPRSLLARAWSPPTPVPSPSHSNSHSLVPNLSYLSYLSLSHLSHLSHIILFSHQKALSTAPQTTVSTVSPIQNQSHGRLALSHPIPTAFDWAVYAAPSTSIPASASCPPSISLCWFAGRRRRRVIRARLLLLILPMRLIALA